MNNHIREGVISDYIFLLINMKYIGWQLSDI